MPLAAYSFRATGRGSKVLEDRFGDALKNMTAVTDRHSAYFALDFLDHQVCLAHILRELEYLTQLDGKQEWSRRLAELLREAIHERNVRPKDVIPSDNNASERGIRKLKIKQKISGTFRPDFGADAFFAIHSVADTAWKNNQSQLGTIRTILSL